MQIRAAVLRCLLNAVHHGFHDSTKIRRLADPVPLTLDLVNPKSIVFDIVSRTTTVPSFKLF